MTELSLFLRDASAFVATSREAIERSAPHIYVSALPFAPKNSAVYAKFSPLCTGVVSVNTIGIDRHGERAVLTLTGHKDAVDSVAYFSDGHTTASGSGQPTILPFPAHYNGVHAVAVSADGAFIVSGSSDKSVRI